MMAAFRCLSALMLVLLLPIGALASTDHNVISASTASKPRGVSSARTTGLADAFAAGEGRAPTRAGGRVYVAPGNIFAAITDAMDGAALAHSRDAAAPFDVHWSEDYPYASKELRASIRGGVVRKVNHLPGIFYLAAKASFCDILMAWKRKFGAAYAGVTPECYVLQLARDRKALQRRFAADEASGKSSVWMAKLGAHRNTSLLSSADEVPSDPDHVIQRYIESPYLVDKHKFELRVFVVITCLEPLTIYLHRDSYLRVATSPYEHDVLAPAARQNEGMYKMGDVMVQTKWSIGEFLEYLQDEGHNATAVMGRAKAAIVKSIIAVEGQLHDAWTADKMALGDDPRRAFELLGYDIMFDEQLQPSILEANFNPDLNVYKAEDEVKRGVSKDLLRLVGAVPPKDASALKPLPLRNRTAALELAGLLGVPKCTQTQVGHLGMQPWRPTATDRPLVCLGDYDLNIALEAERELRRAGAFERLIPSRWASPLQAKFSASHRYADLLMRRVLLTSTGASPAAAEDNAGPYKFEL